MKQSGLPTAILLMLLFSTSDAWANGMNHFARDMTMIVIVFPVSLMVVAAICSLCLSKSRFYAFFYPVIAGLIASSLVTTQLKAPLKGLLWGCVVNTVAALCVGGLSLLIRAGFRSLRAKAMRDKNAQPSAGVKRAEGEEEGRR
jgi:hypothetical protein